MKILVAYEGSNSAKQALHLGIEHAGIYNAEIELVTSLTGGTKTSAEEINNATKELENAKQAIEKAGIAVDTHILVKGLTPGEDIVQFAKEKMIDEIIIGIKRRSKVGKLLFGSNAQYIILNAHCPVVTVK